MPEKATRIPARWRRIFNTFRETQGLDVTELAEKAGVGRHTVAGVVSGRLRRIKPETVGKMVKGLGLDVIDRIELLRVFGLQLPFRAIYSIRWDGGSGSVGFFVDQIMVQERLTEQGEQQTFGDILLPRAVSIARAVHGLGPQNASSLPI